MPKYLDNYRLQRIESLKIDGMEHYSAKQNGSNKTFIMKRFKTDAPPIQSSQQYNELTSSIELLFTKLTNQTMILKLFEHSSIPKCLRMLKTSNSIYFVFQNYPLTSLGEYLRNTWLKIQQKIKLALKILLTLFYIHQKNVVYCGMDLNNIKFDINGKIYFTNFKEAKYLEKDQQSKKSSESAMNQKQFNSLLIEDIFAVGKVLFEIFQFVKINPKYYVFASDIEKRTFDIVAQILQRNISLDTIKTLLKILNEKQSVRTSCTETPQSPRSPLLNKLPWKKEQIRNSTSMEKTPQTLKNSASRQRIMLRSSAGKESLLKSFKTLPHGSESTLDSSDSRVKIQKKFTTSRVMPPMSPRVQRQSPILKQEITSIITGRKTITFIFHCINFLNKQTDIRLVLQLLVKCKQLSTRIGKSITLCQSQLAYEKQRQFLRVVKAENSKTEGVVTQLKEGLLSIVEDGQLRRELMKNEENASLQQSLSTEIHQFLQKQLSSQLSTGLKTQHQIGSSTQIQLSSIQTPLSPRATQTKFSFMPNNLEDKQHQSYEKYKIFYYLSIKLKYNTFERFFQRKNNCESTQLHVLKDEYFHPFESMAISASQLLQEIVLRVERFGRKAKSLKIIE